MYCTCKKNCLQSPPREVPGSIQALEEEDPQEPGETLPYVVKVRRASSLTRWRPRMRMKLVCEYLVFTSNKRRRYNRDRASQSFEVMRFIFFIRLLTGVPECTNFGAIKTVQKFRKIRKIWSDVQINQNELAV